MRPIIVLLLVLWLGLSLAATYTVQSGDTLYSIAQRYATTTAELQRLNRLTSLDLRVGQVLQVPSGGAASSAGALLEVQAKSGGWKVQHVRSALPGEAVSLHVSGSSLEPQMRWNDEQLVVTNDGADWVGIGRELLGSPPKRIQLQIQVGTEVLRSSLELRSDPRAIENVFVGQQILGSLTQKNREFELTILNKAYAIRSIRAWSVGFALPLKTRHSSAFGGARRYYKGAPINYHYGEDFAAPNGTPVLASNDGTVSVAQLMPIRGNLIAVDHGAAVTSIYMHLSRIAVRVGGRVKRGAVIGYVGSTGFSTGAHLHWEMRVRGEATNPTRWVGRLFP